jgi:hypothetical protein
MRPAFIGTLILVASLPVSATSDDKEAEKVKAMRNEVLENLLPEESSSFAAAKAYKKLFTHVRLRGLKTLAEDEDTSIALQAAWELHRKVVKRDPPSPGSSDWIFDKKPLEEFLEFAAKRLKTEPPTWWKASLLKGSVFPGHHHAFDKEGPLPPPATVKVEKDEVVLTSGKQSIKIPKVEFDKGISDFDRDIPTVILCGETLSFVARPAIRGYPYKFICVDSRTGQKQWEVLVWAVRTGPSTGASVVDPVEIRRQGDTVIIYGSGTFGMYAEGFDAKTGKCQFRFCTCYWFNFSEEWGLE